MKQSPYSQFILAGAIAFAWITQELIFYIAGWNDIQELKQGLLEGVILFVSISVVLALFHKLK